MKYNITWLNDSIENGNDYKYLFFWGHQPSIAGHITSLCFSQWWRSPFTINNVIFNTAEHWMMAQKAILFNDEIAYRKIIQSKTPGEAKAIGREVLNFDNNIWEEKRFDIVLKGNMEKFSQNPELKTFLLNTKDRILVEASPVDAIWGIGLAANDERATNPKQWQGLNLLGFALMEVRELLKMN